MSFIILCRTQRGALVPIIREIDGEEEIAQYDKYGDAQEIADINLACQAGDYKIIEITI